VKRVTAGAYLARYLDRTLKLQPRSVQ
jgi:hypothetical protein